MSKNVEHYSHKLVEDLLNSTKIEYDQLALNKCRFVMADVIKGCCSHIRLEGKYQMTFRGDDRAEFYADEQKTDQVLVNLVNNAVKYAPDSLEVIIEVLTMAGSLKVPVTDHGPGIPPQYAAHLFERYYRADSNGRHHTGLGLGLYISAEIIKRQGGRLVSKAESAKARPFGLRFHYRNNHGILLMVLYFAVNNRVFGDRTPVQVKQCC